MATESEGPFGEQLRRHRESAGLTQEGLAERAGLTSDAVSALERGARRHPYPDTVRALADALGLSGEERRELVASVPRRGAAAPSPPTPRPDLPGLPVPPTPLIGREREMGEVGDLLRGEVRLITLTGPGGVGKTRLALGVAQDLGEGFEDGSAFVSLAPVGDPALVVPTLARSLGISEVPGQPLLETVRTHLRQRRMLLVLDNFEQVLDAATDVVDLLATCLDLRLLVTSRAPLRVRGEREYPVRPLAVPELDRVPRLDELEASPAVRLFLDRARSSLPAFEMTRSNAASVAAICRRLDGLPLAIELAAARIRSLSPTELLARLDRALPLLTGGARDLPERQRTMRAAIGWSYQLLGEPEWRLLNRLSVFRGGWGLEAAEAVGAGGDSAEEEVLDLLSSLVEQSLVVTEGLHDGYTRYRMLVPVREYAEERLDQSEEADDIRLRHAGYYLAMAESAESELTGPQQAKWLDRLDRENDNLSAALGWALQRGQADLALRLAGSLWRFWDVRGHFSEGRRWLGEILVRSEGTDNPAHGKALSGAGWMAYWQGEHDRATKLFEQCLSLYRKLGDEERIAAALHQLGAALLQGDPERAIPILEESIDLGRKLGDRRVISSPLLALGSALLERGSIERARLLFEEGLAIGRVTGDRLLIARSLYTLAVVALIGGEFDRIDGMLEESIRGFRDLGHTLGVAYCLDVAGSAAGARGAPRRAARLWGAAEATMSDLNSPRSEHNRRLYASYMELAETELGQEPWSRALAEGREMKLERAIEYARSEAQGSGCPQQSPNRAPSGEAPDKQHLQ